MSGAVWTPFTAFFFGGASVAHLGVVALLTSGAGFPLLFDFFNLYRTSMALEQGQYVHLLNYTYLILQPRHSCVLVDRLDPQHHNSCKILRPVQQLTC